ncbi:MAG: hypothetical protein N2517_02290 [Ignavibacteria bacterium]|nr:hypothetical protein [Ignavibacteria bacterium]
MRIFKIIIGFLLLASCINPFAPRLVEPLDKGTIITDQKTIEGVFKNFQYAYNFKDTLVYSRLLSNNFVFVYRDFELGVDKSWGKEEDVRATFGLFQSSTNIDLVWNDAYLTFGDSLEKVVQRGFYLTIVFSANDIVRLQGKANFKLIFNPFDSIWQISYWRDETYF